MLFSQPLSLTTLIAGKLAVWLLALLAVVIPLPLALLLLFRPETRGLDTLIPMLSWAMLVTCYMMFWLRSRPPSTSRDYPLRPTP